MADVRLINGAAINWKAPPAPNTRVMWTQRTTGGKPVTGGFRTICHINVLNNAAKAQLGHGLAILQSAYNTTVKASAGTHDFDACLDLYIPGVDWWKQQTWLRARGFGCWFRHPPKFGNHIHGFTLPPRVGSSAADDFADNKIRVGIYVPGQLADYYRHAYGLAGQHTAGSDRSYFPPNIAATVFNLPRYVAARAAAS